MLVNPGSEADLLQLPTLKQMKLSLGVMNSAERILSGFNGATIVTIGDVTLPVKVGPMAQQVLFSIVEDLGPYNVIMRWAWLHLIKVIPSTYHQTVNYMTNVGHVYFLTSQLAARQCY